jgi:predicted DCC family thiol-disulfide oxidoreductase YuxK
MGDLTSAAYAGGMTGTVLYDADCGFCTTCAHWLERHGTCSVTPWQSVDLEALHLTVEDVTTAAWWLDSSGQATASGAQAVAAALRTCGPGYRLLGFLMTLPVIRLLAAVVYRWVAANRYRLPGATDACRIDKPHS